MTISMPDLLKRTGLDAATVEVWVAEEWIIPAATATGPGFSEADIARVRLINDLSNDLGVNPEGIGIILHLLDQVHDLRTALAWMAAAAR